MGSLLLFMTTRTPILWSFIILIASETNISSVTVIGFRVAISPAFFSNSLFKNLVQNHDMLVQLFQKNILNFGEISLMMIDGKYSHAVLKKAKIGDFRVQDDFGGTVSQYQPSKKEIQFGENTINKLSFKPIYARVDIIIDNNNNLALSELELIEPEMWFRFFPSSAKKLALKIKNYFN